jgi:hypothetical protein
MKAHLLKNAITILSVAVLLFSCDSKEDIATTDVSGTYVGTLTAITTTGRGNTEAEIPATTTVQNVGNQIEIHCVGENFDETLLLDLYENGEQMEVCFTGEAFEEMYGHMLGGGNMMGGNMQGNNNQWMQHLNNDHEVGDEHFGGFNMHDNTFNFTFKMDNGDFHFQGIKN